jgi:hypothetical protein
VVALVGSECLSDAPQRPASCPAAPGRKGDHEGHADSAVKYSEAGLTGKGEKDVGGRSKSVEVGEALVSAVDRKSRGRGGGWGFVHELV